MAQVIIFGDSITEGFWDSQGGWADRVKRQLFAASAGGKGQNHAIYNLGIDGDTLNDITIRFVAELLPRLWPNQSTVIVVAAGINDSRAMTDPDNFISTPEIYRADLEMLVEQALSTNSEASLLFVGLTPVDEAKTSPIDDSYFSNERIRLFDDILMSFCAEFEFLYVPMFDVFMEAGAKDLLNIDGLHPNDKGHELIEQHVSVMLNKLLK